jgi:hypothetical protein
MVPGRAFQRLLLGGAAGLMASAGCAAFWPRQDTVPQELAAAIGDHSEIRWTATTLESASTPAQRKVLRHGRIKTITGEVVDISCYLQLGKRGEAHIPCGQKCVRNGQPIGLLTDNGKLYLVIPEEHHPRRDGEVSLKERFAELMAKRVRVSGTVTSDGGYRVIFVRTLPDAQ